MRDVFANCPIETTLNLINAKWKVLIIRELRSGTKRFGQLCQNISNVSNKVLTEHLQAMEEDGLISRVVYPEVPPKVEYSLTPLGESMLPILNSMYRWGYEYILNNAPETHPLRAHILNDPHVAGLPHED